MSFQAVNISVLDSSVAKNPLPGTLVKVFDADGVFAVTEGVADSMGSVGFLLPAGTSYQVRVYKFACAFVQPQRITVLEPPGINTFTIYGDPFVAPRATDPRLCCASGFFRSPSGGVAPGVSIHVIPRFDPVLLEGAAVVTPELVTQTDKKGFAQITLIRYGQYNVVIEGLQETERLIHVPNAAAVNLPDLIFPQVVRTSFDASGPVMIPQGTTVTITAHVFTSDLRELLDINSDVAWGIDDSTIVGLTALPATLSFFGLKTGTTTLRARRRSLYAGDPIISIPDPGISGDTLTLTVI